MLDCQKDLFSLPGGVHYLNCAYMAPLPRPVEDAGVEGIRRKRDPSTIRPDDFFRDADRVRRLFGRLTGADPARVALVPAVSYGTGLVARNLHAFPGQSAVVVEGQFPSNVYPWRRLARESGLDLRTVPRPPGEAREWTTRVLESIDRSTALVALPQAHWTDGTLFDLEAVGVRARDVGAAFVVDGTQTVGAHPFELERVRPDLLVCAGYKWLLGPYSLGVMVVGERFERAVPLEETWIGREESQDFQRLVDYREDYRADASRFDVGERSNFILVPMLAAALELLLTWGTDQVAGYCRALTSQAARHARELGYATVQDEARCANIVGLNAPPGLDLARLRSVAESHRVFVSLRGEAVRVSPHVYNDESDVAALVEVLASVSSEA